MRPSTAASSSCSTRTAMACASSSWPRARRCFRLCSTASVPCRSNEGFGRCDKRLRRSFSLHESKAGVQTGARLLLCAQLLGRMGVRRVSRFQAVNGCDREGGVSVGMVMGWERMRQGRGNICRNGPGKKKKKRALLARATFIKIQTTLALCKVGEIRLCAARIGRGASIL